MLKTILGRVAHGFLVGAGFATALGVLLYVYTRWQYAAFEETIQESVAYKEYEGKDLVILRHGPQRPTGNSAFIGTLANHGEDSWRNVEFLVELYAADGAFVDKCTGYLDGTIAPGKERPFKVSCQNCRDPSAPLAYDRYTLTIVGASYVAPTPRKDA